MTWTRYGIRHKPSGNFLPQLNEGKNRGFTYSEPKPSSFPRLFVSQHAAQCALRAYCKGKWFRRHVQHMNDFDEWVDILPNTQRSPQDYEILPIEVKA